MNKDLYTEAVKRLNPEQKRAVEAIEGPVMVNAGPGTGKTQILTLRIANILENTDTKPEQVLALTFTNAGSFTMRERLNQYIGDTAYRVNIFTFHSFCKNIIDHNLETFTQFEYSTVIDDLQKVKIIESIINENSFEYLKGSFDEFQKVQDIVRAINTIKKEGLNSEQFSKLIPVWKEELFQDENVYYKRKYKEFAVGDIKPNEEERITRKINQVTELVEVYRAYQTKLQEQKLYDFSDMILSVLEKLRTNEDFRFDIQEQYQYILVDEHQDTNEGQNELIELLTNAEHLDGRPNIFTVGDEKQSIYRFQGASEETFTYFNSLYKDIEHIALIQNYRSTANILDASGAVIEHSIENPVVLNSNVSENSPIMIGEFSNYKFELLYVAQEIKSKIDAGVDPSEIALLFRANKHVADIKTVLAHHQIPFSVYSKDSVFENVDIAHIIQLIRIILNPSDEEVLAKALFINFLNISGYDAFKICNARYEYSKEQKTLLDILLDENILNKIGVQNTVQIVSFAKCLVDAMTQIKNEHILEFLKNFLDSVGYIKYMLASDLSRDKVAKLDKLFDEIKKQDSKDQFTADDFIKMVDSYHAYHIDIESSNPELQKGVQLMTAHGSKGKEFEYVYMINTIRSAWEKSRSFGGVALPIQDYKGDEHDERRLFYVAMTRAKKGLTVTYAHSDWEGRDQEKSQFVGEIPQANSIQIDSATFENDNAQNFALFFEKNNAVKTIYDPEFIKERFLRRGLTVTALNNYVACPVKYFYRNLIQIPSGYSAHMQYGHIVHRAIEKFLLESKKVEELKSLDFLFNQFESAMQYSTLRGKDKEKYLKQGLESLKAWFDQREGTLTYFIVTEQKIERDFILTDSTEIRINGVLDKIEFLEHEDGGPINLVDYKTGKGFSKKNKIQKEDLKRQLAFYHILLEGYKEDAYHIEKTSLDFIEPGQDGVSEFVSLDIAESDISELKDMIDKVSFEIMSGEFLSKGCLKKDCEWCELHSNSVKE